MYYSFPRKIIPQVPLDLVAPKSPTACKPGGGAPLKVSHMLEFNLIYLINAETARARSKTSKDLVPPPRSHPATCAADCCGATKLLTIQSAGCVASTDQVAKIALARNKAATV